MDTSVLEEIVASIFRLEEFYIYITWNIPLHIPTPSCSEVKVLVP